AAVGRSPAGRARAVEVAVVVREDRRAHRPWTLGVERVARGAGAGVVGVAALPQAGRDAALGRRWRARGTAFVAGPSEVGALSGVYLLPGVPAHIADVDLVGDGVDREAERIAQALRVHLGAVTRRTGGIVERVVGQTAAGQRIDPHDLARQAVDVLRAERSR